MPNTFAELVVRINNSDNGTLFQQICAMFAQVSTMDANSVIVCWQALDMVRSLDSRHGCTIAVDKLQRALIARMQVLSNQEFPHAVLYNRMTLREKFRSVIGPGRGL
ncbi:MAG: hypothetical protein Q7R67_00155 [bacterium]|nr:hypothetical protein [bacterium]